MKEKQELSVVNGSRNKILKGSMMQITRLR